jgi:hypothetical protein
MLIDDAAWECEGGFSLFEGLFDTVAVNFEIGSGEGELEDLGVHEGDESRGHFADGVGDGGHSHAGSKAGGKGGVGRFEGREARFVGFDLDGEYPEFFFVEVDRLLLG